MDETKVLIHLRFAPNGHVIEIGERPAALAPQDWFNTLSIRAGDAYQPLAGGRGVFGLTPDELAAYQPQPA